MTQPSGYNGYGAFAYPLKGATERELMRAVDPGRLTIHDLLIAAINAEITPIWQSCLVSMGLGPEHFLIREEKTELLRPVMDSLLTFPNGGDLQQRFGGWPLLAVYRDGNPTTEPFTLSSEVTVQKWGVDWIVGPLDVGETELISGLAVAVDQLVKKTIRQGFHPAYLNGERQFWGQFQNIKAVGTNGPGLIKIAAPEGDSGLFAISTILESRERCVNTDGHPSDIVYQRYAAFNTVRAIPLPTVTGFEVRGSFPNQTPDPQDPTP